MYVSILIIEDTDTKYDRVDQVLRSELGGYTLKLSRAKNFEEAIALLSRAVFDVVILDILLPTQGGAPTPDAAKHIIQLVASGVMAGVPVMFGLTEHFNSLVGEQAFFQANLFNVLPFDWTGLAWAKLLAARIEYLITNQGFSCFKISERFHTDLCILVARYDHEYVPIRKSMKWIGTQHSEHPLIPGTAITRGLVKIATGEELLTSLVCVGEKGLAPTAAMTATALLAFRPRVIAMLGMCCAFNHNSPHATIGDVCIAREAASWDGGRYESRGKKSKFYAEIKTVVPRFGGNGGVDQAVELGQSTLSKTLRSYWNRSAVQTAVPAAFRANKPRIYAGQILSGLSVVDSPKMKQELARRFSMATALDMEAHAFYSACEKSALMNTQFIAIKGVADLGDGTKASGDFDAIQPIASYMSWLALQRLLGHVL